MLIDDIFTTSIIFRIAIVALKIECYVCACVCVVQQISHQTHAYHYIQIIIILH